MHRHSMSGQEARAKIRPRNPNDWRQIWIVCGYFAVAFVVIAAILFLKNKHRQDVEQNWNSAAATIEDVRPRPVSTVESERGGAMLYTVEILAKYTLDGTTRERWITIDQRSETLADAQLQEFRWKGKQCIVRWKPLSPDQVIAEVS
jgi:hypothetical protein